MKFVVYREVTNKKIGDKIINAIKEISISTKRFISIINTQDFK